MNNIFIDRLWRSLKYEAVNLHEPTDGFVVERVSDQWNDFYNIGRPHSALDGATAASAYSTKQPVDMRDKVTPCPQAQRPQKAFTVNGVLAGLNFAANLSNNPGPDQSDRLYLDNSLMLPSQPQRLD